MKGRLIRSDRLPPATRDAMFSLLSAYFDGVARPQFDADLARKNWVVLIEDVGGILVGFSTILAYETTVAGEVLSVIYSGDTIVSPRAWGAAVLPKAWIGAVYELRTHYSRGRSIWLLLTSGYRTYRFLPVFWKTFFPRPETETPPQWQALLDQLAAEQFGEQFDRASGIVRLTNPQQLRGQLGNVPAGRLADPYIQFFLRRNLGHAAGDELVCVTDLGEANLSPAGRRVVFGAAR